MIFIDRLSLRTSILAYKLVRAGKRHGIQQSVQVLDPIKNSSLSWLLQKGMRLFRISLNEAVFFSGQLRTGDGASIFTTAKNSLIKIAFEAAERTINGSKMLSALNKTWGRNLVLLFLSKYFWRSAGYMGHHTIFKILIADALSRDRGGENYYLVLGLPKGFTPDLIKDIRGAQNLYTYPIHEWSIKKTRLSIILLIAYVGLKRLLNRTTSIFLQQQEFGSGIMPALLLLQEDDLSMNRSYRGQPHWLFNNNPPPAFRTLIIENNSRLRIEPKRGELKEYGVYSVHKDILYSHSAKHSIQDNIKRALYALFKLSVLGPRTTVGISFELAFLFMRASLLAHFCVSQNIKAFMTCENYYHDADAMNLIGTQLGIHTFSYQYSNMSEINPSLLTTANTMCTFSPLFHTRWSNNGIQPKSFVDTGYLFDSSFDLVKKRATELRNRLINNGTQFIVCYFDENVQDNDSKYGIMRIKDHYQEISALAKLIIQDPSTAVIVKTQFRKNTPGVMFKDDLIIESAKATGRFVELFQGKHRNIVFPAEAAIAADIVIGHCIGSTAGLEAALAGSRCILLNPYDMQGANIELFKQADILYSNMDSALRAVSLFRQNKAGYQDLGIWSPVINLFDPFRDGRSANRLRQTLESALL